MFFPWQVAFAGCQGYSAYINNGSYAVSRAGGKVLEGCNIDTPFIPASVVKVATALTAFQILGPDYKFATEFFLDTENNLYIKGYGDPLLLSEEVKAICEELKRDGLHVVNNIFIDNSSYKLHGVPSGSVNSANSYDAPVGATSVNFNSVSVRVNSKGIVSSGEKQTPTLPIMKEMSIGLRSTTQRINICQGGCQPEVVSSQYTCELFSAFLKKNRVTVNGSCGIREVGERTPRIHRFYNPRPLAEIIKSMLSYSSNFIANQIFLTSGAKQFGYPATWEKGRKVMSEVLQSVLNEQEMQTVKVVEGAGLSRGNKITARSMLKILEEFKPYKELLKKYRGVSYKTGTLEGVYNYAGYLDDNQFFVIILNQQKNNRSRFLQVLKKKYPKSSN